LKILELHSFIITTLIPGSQLTEVYQKGVEYITANIPALVESIPKEFGFGVSIFDFG